MWDDSVCVCVGVLWVAWYDVGACGRGMSITSFLRPTGTEHALWNVPNDDGDRRNCAQKIRRITCTKGPAPRHCHCLAVCDCWMAEQRLISQLRLCCMNVNMRFSLSITIRRPRPSIYDIITYADYAPFQGGRVEKRCQLYNFPQVTHSFCGFVDVTRNN